MDATLDCSQANEPSALWGPSDRQQHTLNTSLAPDWNRNSVTAFIRATPTEPLVHLLPWQRVTLVSRPQFRQTLTGARTISTEQSAWRATNSATLPSKKRRMPLCPWEPRTIRLARHSAAEAMILSLMSPISTAVSTWNPALRSLLATRSTISRAPFFWSSNSGA